jgi:hypothetical protein
MTHKEVVLAIEPRACIEKTGDIWEVRKHPGGSVIGSSRYSVQAWQSARMKLFGENVKTILSEIPVGTYPMTSEGLKAAGEAFKRAKQLDEILS